MYQTSPSTSLESPIPNQRRINLTHSILATLIFDEDFLLADDLSSKPFVLDFRSKCTSFDDLEPAFLIVEFIEYASEYLSAVFIALEFAVANHEMEHSSMVEQQV